MGCGPVRTTDVTEHVVQGVFVLGGKVHMMVVRGQYGPQAELAEVASCDHNGIRVHRLQHTDDVMELAQRCCGVSPQPDVNSS